LEMTAQGRIALVAVGNSVYAVAGSEASSSVSAANPDETTHSSNHHENNNNNCVKVLSFAQSSQVHPVIVLDIKDKSMDPNEWSCLFLANGRECAVLDLQYGPPSTNNNNNSTNINTITCGSPRNGGSGMVTLASPILAAATSWPWLAVLTSDGLVSIRSPLCLAISLKTVEVGTRPNDFFVLRTLHDSTTPSSGTANTNTNAIRVPWIMAISYSGQAKVCKCQPDTAQDLADRLMRLSIDAFGANGFPRAELAQALQASFTATSYMGDTSSSTTTTTSTTTTMTTTEPSNQAKELLRQYLEAILGLADFDNGSSTSGGCQSSSWPTETNSANNMATTFSGIGGGTSTSPRASAGGVYHGAFDEAGGAFSGRGSDAPPNVVSSASPTTLVTGTALLCLVCSQLSPPKASLANRAAKACAKKVGVVVLGDDDNGSNSNSYYLSPAAVSVAELIADRLLREATTAFSLLSGSSSTSIARPPPQHQANAHMMDFVEAATWLLRNCGKHERAIDVLYDRLQQHRAPENNGGASNSNSSTSKQAGFWSQIKYESYTATHLCELWGTGKDDACQLVLQSPATHRLLENNPRLGLVVFTDGHPQTASQWRSMMARDDPLLAHVATYPSQVVKLLKSINPAVSYDGKEVILGAALDEHYPQHDATATTTTTNLDAGILLLPIESGRALAVTFLESAIGISTGRPTEEDEFDSLAPDENSEERVSNFHDELCYLLLEGVITERGDDDNETDTELGKIYRNKLRNLLRWPLAKVRSERLLSSLPKSFMQEQALVLGRMDRHEDALRILYCDLQSMDLALEYCDYRYQRQEVKRERERARLTANGLMMDDRMEHLVAHPNGGGGGKSGEDSTCAYLPLVRVALESDPDAKRGTTAAIQVLALRRSAIDRAAALRLLPKNVPVSAVARPFLIPALVDSESQVRRLTVVSSLLRARYVALKNQLTDAQLKAQSNLHVVPQLRSLNLGDPLHSTKPIKARPSSSASSTFPDVVIVKHFFPRHVVIQAKVTNNAAVDGRTLGSVAFVVAESSEEAIQPALQVPLKVLPYKATGSTWCVLAASPQRMEGTAILTCELRYTVLAVDATTGAPLSFGLGNTSTSGRTFVEELQDLEVFASHFS
jgi:hypothetical protein